MSSSPTSDSGGAGVVLLLEAGHTLGKGLKLAEVRSTTTGSRVTIQVASPNSFNESTKPGITVCRSARGEKKRVQRKDTGGGEGGGDGDVRVQLPRSDGYELDGLLAES